MIRLPKCYLCSHMADNIDDGLCWLHLEQQKKFDTLILETKRIIRDGEFEIMKINSEYLMKQIRLKNELLGIY